MKSIILAIVFSVFLSMGFADLVSSQEYRMLQPLPRAEDPSQPGTTTPTQYISGMFILIIGIAGVLAVIMIIVGGVKYMTTDAMGAKNDAKKTIQNALFGLLLALGAWIILYSIGGERLTNFTISLDPVEVASTTPPTTPPTCPNCVALSVSHYPPGRGCAAPGPCMVNSELNNRLIGLRGSNVSFTVSEAYPPTIQHRAACHNSGTCVDAVISNTSPASIRAFILAADNNSLRAVFEIPPSRGASSRRAAIIAAGVPASQVIIVSGITGEHFSVYMR